MAFDFNSLSTSPIPQGSRTFTGTTTTSGFDFNALPKSPVELIAEKMSYHYGATTPEAYGLGQLQPQETKPQTQWGIGVTPANGVSFGTAQTTPKIAEQLPEPKSYFEGLADTLDAIAESGARAKEQYEKGETNAATKYSTDIANITSIAVAPIGELFNQIPVVGGVMKVMSEGLQYGPKGAGEALSNLPGYKQILEKNPWITDYSEAVTPTVENATVTALNLATLLGTVETGVKATRGGAEALKYRTRTDATGNRVTRDYAGDVVYIEDKAGVPTYGEKPANYPLIRLNSSLQDIKESTVGKVNEKNAAKNADSIKEIITGTKSGQNWWAQNKESEAASQRVASKVDLETAVDTTGTVNTKPQIEYFNKTYLEKTESTGYKLLEQEDASAPVDQIVAKLTEEFSHTNLPQSIVQKAIANVVKKLETAMDEAGNVKLLELAKEKSAAQRSANYERTRNNSNAEIKNKTVGRALRLVVEETSKTDVAKVNGELTKLYQELGILEKLDGMKVNGGKLGKYFAQISGNIVGGLAGGAVGGPVGAAASAVVGGELASALRGKIMSGKFKKVTPSGEIGATLEKAVADTKKPNLKVPDKRVVAPKGVPKTKEITTLEDKIAKNVKAQEAAIKAGDFTLVATLKEVYQILVQKLKDAIKYLNENGSVGMTIKKSVTPESVARKADKGDMNVLAKVIDDYDNAILDPKTNATLDGMGLGRATREERISFAKEVFNEKDGVAMREVVKPKDMTASEAKKAGMTFEEWVGTQGEMKYHQTSPENASKIEKEGFRLDKLGSGNSDVLPLGVNTKSHNRELLIQGKGEQMEVFVPKTANVKKFETRQQAESFFRMHDSELGNEYYKAYRRYQETDKKYLQIMRERDELQNKLIKDKAGRDALRKHIEEDTKIIDEWDKEGMVHSKDMQRLATEISKKDGIDAIEIVRDEGGFGRVTDNLIVLDPSQIKTRSQLKAEWDKAN